MNTCIASSKISKLETLFKMIEEFFKDFNSGHESPMNHEEEFTTIIKLCKYIKKELESGRYSKEDTLIAQSIVNYVNNITPIVERTLKLKVFW